MTSAASGSPICCRVVVSHRRTVPSSAAETRMRPFGLTASAVTVAVVPGEHGAGAPPGRDVPGPDVSPVAANRSRPSGLNATERNCPSTLISPSKPASVRVSTESHGRPPGDGDRPRPSAGAARRRRPSRPWRGRPAARGRVRPAARPGTVASPVEAAIPVPPPSCHRDALLLHCHGHTVGTDAE